MGDVRSRRHFFRPYSTYDLVLACASLVCWALLMLERIAAAIENLTSLPWIEAQVGLLWFVLVVCGYFCLRGIEHAVTTRPSVMLAAGVVSHALQLAY